MAAKDFCHSCWQEKPCKHSKGANGAVHKVREAHKKQDHRKKR